MEINESWRKMGNTALEKLINGSDIRGIAIDTKEHKANLTQKEVKSAHGFYAY